MLGYIFVMAMSVYQLGRQILTAVQGVAQTALGINGRIDCIEKIVRDTQRDLGERGDQLVRFSQVEICLLHKILNAVAPSLPVSFHIVLSSTDQIQLSRQGAPPMNFEMKDDGSAVATITDILDKAGLPASLTGDAIAWSSSDSTPGPSAVSLTPAPDGLSCAIAPATPPTLATGLTITATATLPDSSQLAEASDPMDVIADQAVGFKVSLQ